MGRKACSPYARGPVVEVQLALRRAEGTIIPARDYFDDRIKGLMRFDEVFVPGKDVIFRLQAKYRELGKLWNRDDRSCLREIKAFAARRDRAIWAR